MNTADIIELPIEPTAPAAEDDAVEAEQLGLDLTTADGRPLRPSRVHARFRLDSGTRERGLRHVAEIRARLAANADAADESAGDDNVVALPAATALGRRAS